MPLDDSSVDVIAVVHYQDLQPSEGPLLMTEAQERAKSGLDMCFPCGVCAETVLSGIQGIYLTGF